MGQMIRSHQTALWWRKVVASPVWPIRKASHTNWLHTLLICL